MIPSADAQANKKREESKVVDTFLKTIMTVFRYFATPVEVLFRHTFGMRYLGILPTLCTLSALWLTMFLTTLLLSGNGPRVGLASYIFIGVIVLAAIVHRTQTGERFRDGEQLYSYSAGTSIAARFVPLSQNKLQRFLEPLAAIALGFAFWFLGTLTGLGVSYIGVVFILGGFALAIKEQIKHEISRNRFFDLMDSIIEGQSVGVLADRGWWGSEDTVENSGVDHLGYHQFLPPHPKDPAQAAAVIMAMSQDYRQPTSEEQIAAGKFAHYGENALPSD